MSDKSFTDLLGRLVWLIALAAIASLWVGFAVNRALQWHAPELAIGVLHIAALRGAATLAFASRRDIKDAENADIGEAMIYSFTIGGMILLTSWIFHLLGTIA